MRRPAVNKKRPKRKFDEAALIRRLSPPIPPRSGEGPVISLPRERGRVGWGLPLVSAQSSARVSAWLASVAASAAGRALNSLVRENPALAKLIGGIAETAPYLWDLVRADPARFLRLLSHDPDRAGCIAARQGAPRRRVGAHAGCGDA